MCLLGVLLAVGACAHQEEKRVGSPGAIGAGDPYFPRYGNGGYDVAGYDLALRYDPGSGRLGGTATITATATQDLNQFNLDLAHLTASAVIVNGRKSTAKKQGDELVVVLPETIARGRRFTAVVTYGGTPTPLVNKFLGAGGWQRTADGAIALGEPESASTWFPVNDHPSDKATFKLAMTVPKGLAAISNGAPGGQVTVGSSTTWNWVEKSPMASYLTFVVIGKYRVSNSTHDGKPLITAVPESMPASAPGAESIARTGEIADYLATWFGPYPFDAYGGVVVDDRRIGYALESQSRPVYGNTFFHSGANPTVVAHELAHQWYGDSVGLRRWADIWLNEGFATYAEWLWLDHEGRRTISKSFDRAYRTYDWNQPALDPGVLGLFGDGVYLRAAMTVQALRKKIGDPAFRALVRAWPAERRDGTGTTAEFIAAAEKISGKDLEAFFQTWLSGTKKPPRP